MRDLPQRMDAGVCAPRPVDLEFPHASRFLNRPFELTLNGPGILLDLPPAVASAGVLDRHLESHAHALTSFSVLGSAFWVRVPLLGSVLRSAFHVRGLWRKRQNLMTRVAVVTIGARKPDAAPQNPEF